MDYEKKYNEALERARGLHGTVFVAAQDLTEQIFPELRESEDERIRKELVALFIEVRNSEGNEGYWHDLKVADILAWLEKQKEQMPAEWSEEDEKLRQNLMSLLANMRGDRITEETYQKYYPWLKSLRPSWKPSEEQMSMLLAVINDPNNAGAESCYMALNSIYNNLKKLM